MSGLITVIGVAGADLSAEARRVVAEATLVVGGARHLEAVPIPSGARRIVLGPLAPALEAVAEHCSSDHERPGPAVVLASGDPGFFGIVRALRARGLDLDVIPAVSSVAAACAAAGVSWEDAVVVSAHGSGGGRSLRRAANVCRAYPKVALLTGPTSQPHILAAELLRTSKLGVSRRLVVLERLFETDHQADRLTLEQAVTRSDWLEPNVVLCLAEDAACGVGGDDDGSRRLAGSVPRWHAGPVSAAGVWAKPESAYAYRDSMITKSEVRALALAHLAPGLGDLVWDVGAGSGAVGIECGRHGAAVIAIERDVPSCERIRANAEAHGVSVAVAAGSAPDILDQLPDPDAAFIGGGGLDVVRAVVARSPQRIVVALAAVERVGECIEILAAGDGEVGGLLTQSSRLAMLPDGAHRFAAQNPVFLLWAERKATAGGAAR